MTAHIARAASCGHFEFGLVGDHNEARCADCGTFGEVGQGCVFVPWPSHCPQCGFTQSGLKHCPNCVRKPLPFTLQDPPTTDLRFFQLFVVIAGFVVGVAAGVAIGVWL